MAKAELNLGELIASGPRDEPFEGRLVAIDPGSTTGVAYFDAGKLVKHLEVDSRDMTKSAKWIQEIFHPEWLAPPDTIVMEDYRVYGWRSKHHAWSSLHTTHVIGAIELQHSWFQEDADYDVSLVMQSAQIGKSFWTDDKLKRVGMYVAGARHATDAIRHGLHWLVFGAAKSKSSTKHNVG